MCWWCPRTQEGVNGLTLQKLWQRPISLIKFWRLQDYCHFRWFYADFLSPPTPPHSSSPALRYPLRLPQYPSSRTAPLAHQKVPSEPRGAICPLWLTHLERTGEVFFFDWSVAAWLRKAAVNPEHFKKSSVFRGVIGRTLAVSASRKATVAGGVWLTFERKIIAACQSVELHRNGIVRCLGWQFVIVFWLVAVTWTILNGSDWGACWARAWGCVQRGGTS